MTLFLITLAFTLLLFVGAALLFNWCRRRTAASRHPLSTTCQEDGGPMCCGCASGPQTTISRR